MVVYVLSELPQLSASLLPPKMSARAIPATPSALCHHRISRWRLNRPPLFAFLPSLMPMATSARFVSSLRRTALSSRAPSRFQCLRPSYQVRWNSTPTPTSATSEPHQPDAQGGVKGKAAPTKTIQYTSESCVIQDYVACNRN